MSWFTWLGHWDQQAKQKACKIEKQSPFSFREILLFQLANTTISPSLPPAVLHKSLKLRIVFYSPVLDAVSPISLMKPFFCLYWCVQAVTALPKAEPGLEPWSSWLAALNVSNETTLPPSTSWRQMFSHTILCKLLKSPQWYPEEVILAQTTVQDSEH